HRYDVETEVLQPRRRRIRNRSDEPGLDVRAGRIWLWSRRCTHALERRNRAEDKAGKNDKRGNQRERCPRTREFFHAKSMCREVKLASWDNLTIVRTQETLYSE